jgi:hypothetical protein
VSLPESNGVEVRDLARVRFGTGQRTQEIPVGKHTNHLRDASALRLFRATSPLAALTASRKPGGQSSPSSPLFTPLTKRAPVDGDTEKLHLEGAVASGSGRVIRRSRDA